MSARGQRKSSPDRVTIDILRKTETRCGGYGDVSTSRVAYEGALPTMEALPSLTNRK
jgi:hypothetical protein